jgi:hypothetical protein
VPCRNFGLLGKNPSIGAAYREWPPAASKRRQNWTLSSVP